MNKNIHFVIVCSMLNLFSYASSDKPLTLPQSIFTGGVAGSLEVFAPGHAFSVGMNKAINQEKFNWRDIHKGGMVNAVVQFPITAVVKTVAVKGSQCIESTKGNKLSEAENAAIAVFSGCAGAVIDTPANTIQLFQQKKGNESKNAWQACRELGPKALSKSYGANALLKEGPFALAWLFGAPKGKAFMQEYIENEAIAQAVGGSAVGVVTAVATQPGAVIRNKMSNDPFGVTYKTTFQTIGKIYEESGPKGFFKGLPQRGTRVAIAIPLYFTYGTLLEQWIKK